MRFLKTGNIYKIIRITGSQDNILGISFVEKNGCEADIEVIEWDLSNINKSGIRTPKEEVLEQTLSGLARVNKSLGTNYKLSKIYYVPFDMSKNRIYSSLIAVLIKQYHLGNEFEEI